MTNKECKKIEHALFKIRSLKHKTSLSEHDLMLVNETEKILKDLEGEYYEKCSRTKKDD